jgi:O-acetyl-ADP-ribose deacetylase (regulator of RNase III)
MFRQEAGDILGMDVEALVNTVNCIGYMGRGLALQFSKAFPDNLKAYQAACKRGEVVPGRMFIYATGQMTNPKFIINFPTKRHWKGKSRMEDIESGLVDLAAQIQALGIQSVAIPPLGCGLGGMDWGQVAPRIEKALAGISGLQVHLFPPAGTPEAREMVQSREVPVMTQGRAALVTLMNRYLGGLMDPCVSLLEVHKLMYFLQEAEEPLRLSYVKHLYGPYAENLRNVLTRIEGHFVSGYSDGGDTPTKQLELVPGAVEEAERFLVTNPTTQANLERVVDLVEGFETPFGLELLSTVHWVARHEGATTLENAQRLVYGWNARKKRFTPEQIRLAWQTLKDKGWLTQTLVA